VHIGFVQTKRVREAWRDCEGRLAVMDKELNLFKDIVRMLIDEVCMKNHDVDMSQAGNLASNRHYANEPSKFDRYHGVWQDPGISSQSELKTEKNHTSDLRGSLEKMKPADR